MSNPITVTYTNWRGQTRQRTVIPVSVRYGTTAWHTNPGWLLKAKDAEKGEMREFALADCDFTNARAEERERCAKIAESRQYGMAWSIAAAIRAADPTPSEEDREDG